MQSNSLSWNSDDDIKRVIHALKSGELIVGSSDTVLGLLAAVTNAGFNKLTDIKQRSEKPYIIVIGSTDKLSFFAQKPTTNSVTQLIEHCWPGPLTLILKKSNTAPSFLATTVAVRMPNHAGLLKLLAACDGLFSTSANISGKPTPRSIDEIDPALLSQVAYIINGTQPAQTQPSTILDCTGATIKLVRPGALDVTYLEKVAGVSFEK